MLEIVPAFDSSSDPQCSSSAGKITVELQQQLLGVQQ